MSLDTGNINFKLAYDFVNNTNCSLYLTGKAGTGKTTFLKYVRDHCKKSLVIVAPTGVAAINAGGVTMHSFFHLPFGPYLPDEKTGFGLNSGVVDKHALMNNLKFNSTKRKLIEQLQLLIIDEVSMLRSDTLDAIDTILKIFRKNKIPFGGVQVLFIGDLYQLPPVVRDNEKMLLDRVYQSPFFFDAKVLQQTELVYIELKKIYRQSEAKFIDLLNKLRHNSLEEDDFYALNKRYDPAFVGKDKNYITLTTHNHKADVINSEELRKLTTKVQEFKGEIKGEFGDKQLPTEMFLQLKVGAQVMFVKNDSSPERKYYNGKIAIISNISNDEIYVRFPNSNEEMLVTQSIWENVNYTLNKETNKIDEKISGEFIQYPLRLAWAITIHKSQGLTFEKAIIDAGQSFAPGQVYVALSRCTSLEGVVLHSRITEAALHTEERIVAFTHKEIKEHELHHQLIHEQFKYETEKLFTIFKVQKLLDALYEFEESTLLAKSLPGQTEAVAFSRKLIEKIKEMKGIADKFIDQLKSILNEHQGTKGVDLIKERVKKGTTYFVKSIYQEIIQPLEQYIVTLDGKSKINKYRVTVLAVEDICWQKVIELQECSFQNEVLFDLSQIIKKSNHKIKAVKSEKGGSAKESLAYFIAGKSVSEIAQIRNMVVSTIEKHLIDFIKTGELEIARFLSNEQVNKIRNAYMHLKEKSSSSIKAYLNDEFTYNEIRMVINHMMLMKEIKSTSNESARSQ